MNVDLWTWMYGHLPHHLCYAIDVLHVQSCHCSMVHLFQMLDGPCGGGTMGLGQNEAITNFYLDKQVIGNGGVEVSDM